MPQPRLAGDDGPCFRRSQGKRVGFFVDVQDRSLLEGAFRNSGGSRVTVELRLRGGDGAICDFVLRLRHRDGTYRAVLVKATPSRRDEGGEVLKAPVSAVDSTDQERREEHGLDLACELTGLERRRALVDALDKAVASPQGSPSPALPGGEDPGLLDPSRRRRCPSWR
jgi:hypothetical protein